MTPNGRLNTSQGRQKINQATRWRVPCNQVKAARNEIVDTVSGHRLGYGELAEAASKLLVPSHTEIKLKSPADFIYIGKAKTPNVDGFDITTGRAHYGIDTRLQGMFFGLARVGRGADVRGPPLS